MTSEGYNLVLKGLIRRSKKSRIFGISLFTLSTIFFIILLTETTKDAEFGVGTYIWISFLYLLFGGAGVTVIIQSFEHKFNKPKILRAIEEKNQNYIVWIHHKTEKSGAHSIFAYNDLGKLTMIKCLPSNNDKILAYLQTHFPNAKTGFSEEYKKILRKNPKELLRPNPSL